MIPNTTIHLFQILRFSLIEINERTSYKLYQSWWFILGFLSFLAIILFYTFRKVFLLNKDVVKSYSQIENSKEQYSLYLLFMGTALPLIEFGIQYFDLREDETISFNLFTSVVLLTIYFLSQQYKVVFNVIRELFVGVFILYLFVTVYRIFENPQYVSTYFDYLILFFLSYSIFRTIKSYWIFIGCNLLFIIGLFYYGYISKLYFVVLTYSCIMTSLINHVRYIVNLRAKDNFLFADNIVNKGTTLVLGVNKLGEVVYCSQTIKQILGYTSDEVKGLNFWKLTQDKKFKVKNYVLSDRLYTRKLLCKDGSYKHIQWKDSKYSDELYVGVGQDVTDTVNMKNLYKNLIESASDIIFETDRKGDFIFINKYAQTALGLNEKDALGKHFSIFIRKDYVEQIQEFYRFHILQKEAIPSVEFPIVKADGKEIWISQNVTVSRNNDGKVLGFSAIARDITLLKNIEIEQSNRRVKIENFNKTINSLVIKPYTKNDTFHIRIQKILKAVAQGSKINRISYWEYLNEDLHCVSLYELDFNEFTGDFTSYKKESPIYFGALENDKIIVASDVYNNYATQEFVMDYFPVNNIKSMLDVPVLINGKLHSIMCFETTKNIREWDNDDVNFARSVADVVSLTHETFKRIETEQKLALKSEILSAVAKTTVKLLSSNNIQSIFYQIFEIIGKATKVDRVYFFENDATSNSMSIKTEWANSSISKLIDLPELQNMQHSENTLFIDYLSKNKMFIATVKDIKNDIVRNRLEAQGTLTILIFPIFVKNNFYGSIGLDDCTTGRIWTNDEAGVLQILANNISTAIERIDNENLLIQSEERFKLLANNIPGTVYLSQNDEKYSKSYVNDGIENLTGYTKSDFLENRIYLVDLVHPDDRENLIKMNQEAVQKHKPLHLTYRLKRKTGEYIWVEEFSDAVVKDGEIQFLEGILLDITQKKEIENEIKARELAEASNKSKSEFLANMSHEIRTPLNAIIGFTDLLKDTELNESQKEYIFTVNQSADILLDVVNDILDFSKIETGKFDLDYQKTDIYELSHQIIDIIKFDSEQKHIQLELIIEEDVPQFVSIDSLRMKQILLNLLSNAVKFTDKGKVQLCIKLESIKNDTASIIFQVIDSGIGIKKDNHKKIFEPFSQEDNSTTRKYGGTGLGLAISNNILKLMGSELQLISNYRKGSTFYFKLDLIFSNEGNKFTAVDAADIEIDFEDLSYDILKNVLSLPKKVLIIEDNKINMLLARTLTKKILPNSIIFEVENGKIGVERCMEINPDIVLLDIQMPILNGYETAKKIRQFDEEVPIIALTAGTIKGEREKCIESGMNDYISKPINKDLFESILIKWLRKKTNIL